MGRVGNFYQNHEITWRRLFFFLISTKSAYENIGKTFVYRKKKKEKLRENGMRSWCCINKSQSVWYKNKSDKIFIFFEAPTTCKLYTGPFGLPPPSIKIRKLFTSTFFFFFLDDRKRKGGSCSLGYRSDTPTEQKVHFIVFSSIPIRIGFLVWFRDYHTYWFWKEKMIVLFLGVEKSLYRSKISVRHYRLRK